MELGRAERMKWGIYHHKKYTLSNSTHQCAFYRLQNKQNENYKDMLMFLGFPEEMY